MLLIGVNLKLLTVSGCQIGDGLSLQIHPDNGTGILLYACKQLVTELGAHGNRQHKAVQQVSAMDIGKTVRYDHPDTVSRDSPRGMLTA